MMKIAMYSTCDCEKKFLENANDNKFNLVFLKEALTIHSVELSKDCTGIAILTSDDASAPVLYALKELGIQFIVTRSTGFDHIDLTIASELGIHIANAPAYSSNGMADNAVAIMLALSILRMTTNMCTKVEENVGF